MTTLFTRPRPVEVFGTEPDAVQLVWRAEGTDRVRIDCDGRQVESEEHPGSIRIGGLTPATAYEATVHHGGTTHRLPFRTQPDLGPERFRFATVSDLHLGERRFGLLRTIRSRQFGARYAIECVLAALDEILEWGAERLVIKGDITDVGRPGDWDIVCELLEALPVPTTLTVGNHDTIGHRESLDALRQLDELGIAHGPIQVLDEPGVRLVIADTTVPRRSFGRVNHITDSIVDAASHAPGPTVVLLHHHLSQPSIPYFWPLGIPSGQSHELIERLDSAAPGTFLTSGHTHRNRSYRRRSLQITEVGSPKDFPGCWAGYSVHDAGIRQTVHRTARADVLEWTDHTRRAAFGAWGWWSPGRLGDRCVSHQWSGSAGGHDDAANYFGAAR